MALAPSVTVNCVAPGLMERTQVVVFCESDSITGQTQVIDSGGFFR